MRFLTGTRDTALPRGTPCPASPRCSFTCCAWCLWILCCFSTPKQTSCSRVCSSPAFLTCYAAFSARHNSLLLLCRLPSVLQRVPRPWCQRDRIQRIAPLLSRKLYRIIYKRASMRYELGWGIPQLPMDSEFRQGCTGKWGLYMFSLVLQAG